MKCSCAAALRTACRFDHNYTLAKSEDMGSKSSVAETSAAATATGHNGFLIQLVRSRMNYGRPISKSATRSTPTGSPNLPFGTGQAFGGGVGNAVNTITATGSIAGLLRWTSASRSTSQLPFVLGDQLERPRQRDAGRSGSLRNADHRERG